MKKKEMIKILPGDRFNPFSLAKKLEARCILESSSFQKGRERYSLLLVKEAFHIVQDKRGVIMRPIDRSLYGKKGYEKEYKVGGKSKDILDVLQYFAKQHKAPLQDFPFPAGGIGFLSFEFAKYCDTIKLREKDHSLNVPEAAFIFGHVFIVFDHYTDLLYLIGLNYEEHSIDLDKAIAETEAKINDLNFNYLQEEDKEYLAELVTSPEEAKDYMKNVSEMRKEIYKGNLLQGVPSRRLSFKTELPGIEAYRRLRRTNPSPYLFYLDYGSYELFGASPEVHVKVKDGKVIVRPIAGTRKRGKDRDEDLALEKDLLSDPKERAEHLMLIDLGRNDVGRVSKPGTVKVTDYMTIERYSHVMHIVSQVEGELEADKTGIDALRATFPAGTVSGAPKIKAIEIIDRLEKIQRSFYSGIVGYFEPGGNLDSCIAIRSGLVQDGHLHIQAGGGIVYDSVPERELEETREKMGALLNAIGLPQVLESEETLKGDEE